MEAIGVFSSCVTAFRKLSWRSFRADFAHQEDRVQDESGDQNAEEGHAQNQRYDLAPVQDHPRHVEGNGERHQAHAKGDKENDSGSAASNAHGEIRITRSSIWIQYEGWRLIGIAKPFRVTSPKKIERRSGARRSMSDLICIQACGFCGAGWVFAGRSVQSLRSSRDRSCLQQEDAVVVRIEFVPCQAMASRDWMSMMIVVPALAAG